MPDKRRSILDWSEEEKQEIRESVRRARALDSSRPPCSVSLAEHQEKIGKLYDADPDCWHELDKNCMSGIRCTKCGGWYCL